MSKPRVLVTGGAGYLGSILVPSLLEAGYAVTVLDCFWFGDHYLKNYTSHPDLSVIPDNVLNHDNHLDLFKNVYAVVHLASISNDPTSDLDPNLTIRTNFFATQTIARRAKLEGVKKFIFVSSCSVYGANGDRELFEQSETGPLTLYALTKLQAEPGLLKLNSPEMSVTIFRLATLFGFAPRMRFDLAVNVMIKCAYQGQNLVVNGAGSQYRPFLHVKDASKAISSCLEKPFEEVGGQVFNVGSNDMNYSISNLASEIQKFFPNVAIKNIATNNDSRSYRVNFDKFEKTFGWKPQHNIADAVHEIKNAIDQKKLPNLDSDVYYNLLVLKKANLAKIHSVYSPASVALWNTLPKESSENVRKQAEATLGATKSKPKIIGVILAYNCGRMLKRCKERIPAGLLDDVIVMDDGSKDNTSEVAKSLGLKVFRHEPNRGYGGNLKAGVKKALEMGADYIVEIHGDGAQFNPIAIKTALPLIEQGYDFILGSRFQKPIEALKNGMPLIRFFANIGLSFFDRLILRLPLTEFHTGFRIYGRKFLTSVPFDQNSNDYLFSFQIIVQAAYYKMRVGEVPVEADYHSEHTSHAVSGAAVYAVRTFVELAKFTLARLHLAAFSTYPRLLQESNNHASPQEAITTEDKKAG